MLLIPDYVNTVIDKINSAGYEAFLVGGCVRDSLMGTKPKDYDIATSAPPQVSKQIFSDFQLIETGIKHGTVTVLVGNNAVEITTFRKDGNYQDHRHPDKVYFTGNLLDDLSRRDFTINSMAFHPETGLIDPFGGAKDIAGKTIRCVGNANDRFNEDALRIMRALRFSSVLGFHLSPDTEAALYNKMHLLKTVSMERILSELKLLLCGMNIFSVLTTYIDVLGIVIPELIPMKNYDQNNPHHCFDLLVHSAKTVQYVPPVFVLRAAALLHDIGKPSCRSRDSDGTCHYYGHAEKSAEYAETVLMRLRVDRNSANLIDKLILFHGMQITATERAVRRSMSKLGEEAFFHLLTLKEADAKACRPEVSGNLSFFTDIKEIAGRILSDDSCFSLKQLAVNGNDLISFGIPEGKEIGTALNHLLNAVIDGKVANSKDVLLKYLQSRQNYDIIELK